jgi:hypothetical protein
MPDQELERRICGRFPIPEAVLRYRISKSFFKRKSAHADPYLLIDLSRGGIRFGTHELLKLNHSIEIDLFIPGETLPLTIRGKVTWYSTYLGADYRYQIGVQFLPYGKKRDQNPPAILEKIIALEESWREAAPGPYEEAF